MELDDLCPLRELVRVLKAFPEEPGILPEIYRLTEFSTYLRLPILVFNPRFIIENMLATHAFRSHIYHKMPINIKTLTYQYNFGEEVEEYIFSNNMRFYADVLTICYLCCMKIFNRQLNHEFANDLMILMKTKYFIEDMNFHPQTITLEKIALSYPSVFYSIVHYNTENISCLKTLFSPDISNVFFLPFLASIIPVLDSNYKTPLALLLAASVALDIEHKPSYVLYQRILTLYFSEVYPNYLKLELCRHLGIVYMIENEYKYAPYFTTIRNKAIKLIRALKRGDRSLKYTLSKI